MPEVEMKLRVQDLDLTFRAKFPNFFLTFGGFSSLVKAVQFHETRQNTRCVSASQKQHCLSFPTRPTTWTCWSQFPQVAEIHHGTQHLTPSWKWFHLLYTWNSDIKQEKHKKQKKNGRWQEWLSSGCSEQYSDHATVLHAPGKEDEHCIFMNTQGGVAAVIICLCFGPIFMSSACVWAWACAFVRIRLFWDQLVTERVSCGRFCVCVLSFWCQNVAGSKPREGHWNKMLKSNWKCYFYIFLQPAGVSCITWRRPIKCLARGGAWRGACLGILHECIL